MKDMDGFSKRDYQAVGYRGLFSFGLLTWSIIAAAPALAGACRLGNMAEFPISMTNLQPEVAAKINGSDVRFVLDSGAFYSMIDGANAARLHLQTYPAPIGFTVKGVGGAIGVKLTRVAELKLNNVPLRNMEFIVGGNDMGGGRIGLLGRNILEIADAEYDFAHGLARLMVPQDCDNSVLAYWLHPGEAYSVIDTVRPTEYGETGSLIKKRASFMAPIMGVAYVNNVAMRVMFDTGASTSQLSVKAAARAGIKLDSPGVTSAGYGWGIGRSTVATYLAPVSSFKIGDEEIRNTRLRLSEGEIKDVDMLVGADFFLSHHVYVAKSQNKLYFSYNGGPVFNLNPVLAALPGPTEGAAPAALPDGRPTENPPASGQEGAAAGIDTTTPPSNSSPAPPTSAADAADAERRGRALASRRQLDQALTALTLACKLAPAEPDYVYQRGMVYWQSKQAKLALADFDRTLELQPNHIGALLARANMRIENGESSGAAADLGAISATSAKEDSVRGSLAADYVRLDLFSQAIGQYDLWIAAHPLDVWLASALNGRCRARALGNIDLPLALADCNEALKHAAKSSPFFEAASNSRALVLLRLGRYDKSIADFDASLKIDAKDAWSLYGRGMAETRANQLPAGQSDIAKAQILSPKIAEQFAKFGLAP